MHPVKRMHFIAVSGNERISADIVDGDFRERIDGKDDNFKHSIQRNQTEDGFQRPGKVAFVKNIINIRRHTSMISMLAK